MANIFTLLLDMQLLLAIAANLGIHLCCKSVLSFRVTELIRQMEKKAQRLAGFEPTTF